MHRVKEKQAGAKAAETGAATTEPSGAATVNGDGDRSGTKVDSLTPENLGRYLAAEVSLRESGEERGATALARYFKLTLVIAGFNMLVASASLVMVFFHSGKPQTIVVTQPTPSSPPAALPKAPPVETMAASSVPMSPAPMPPAAVAPAPMPPAKTPLLGEPSSPPNKIPLLGRPRPERKRSVAASAPRAPKVKVVVPTPVPSEPPVFARYAAEESAPVPDVSQATERW